MNRPLRAPHPYLGVLMLLGLPLLGCSKQNPSADQAQPAASVPSQGLAAKVEAKAEAKPEQPKAPASAPAPSSGPYEKTTSAYASLHQALAEDNHPAAQAAAGQLGKAAQAAAAKAGDSKAHLEGIAKASTALAAAADLPAQRLAFGQVSRHLVGLMLAVPELQTSRFIFSCPMAKGYKKWVQTKQVVTNPYMGKKMLKCGGRSDWKV